MFPSANLCTQPRDGHPGALRSVPATVVTGSTTRPSAGWGTNTPQLRVEVQKSDSAAVFVLKANHSRIEVGKIVATSARSTPRTEGGHSPVERWS